MLNDTGNAEVGERTHRAWTPLARALVAAGDNWTLMIALQLAAGGMRLSRLHERLPGVSTGVLDRHVQQMVALGLVTRTRFREMPPRVELQLTEAGRELLPVAGALARWGMRHMWSAPHERERVDVDALLRSLPVLVEEVTLRDGSLEAIVDHADLAVCHRYRVDAGSLRVEGGTGEEVTARIVGSRDAWIVALGPQADYEQLSFHGDRQFAESIFDALPGRE